MLPGMMIGELHAFSTKLVDVGRQDFFLSETSKVTIAKVVGKDVNDVWFVCCMGNVHRKCSNTAQCNHELLACHIILEVFSIIVVFVCHSFFGVATFPTDRFLSDCFIPRWPVGTGPTSSCYSCLIRPSHPDRISDSASSAQVLRDRNARLSSSGAVPESFPETASRHSSVRSGLIRRS